MKVFPVKIALKGEMVWLGWVFPEDGDAFFLKSDGCLISSCISKNDLMLEITKIFSDAKAGVETFFDFDSIARGLDDGVIIESNFALDVWNLSTDLYYTFDGVSRRMSESRLEVYSRLFSQSEAAPLVDVQRAELSAHDIEVIREVLFEAFEFFAQKIALAKAGRS